MILAAAAAFALFGESVLTLKVGVLAFGAATLVALYALGRIWFGRSAGVVAGLSYLAGPPLVAHGALITMGSHGESTLFSLLQFLIFFGLLSGSWRSTRTWALFGFVSGLGLWFCYTSGLSLAACGLSWLAFRGFPKLRELGFATAGLLVGLLPWLLYNLQHDFVGVLRIVELFGYGDPIDAWVEQSALDKLRSLGRRDMLLGLLFPFGSEYPLPLNVAVLAGFFLPFLLALWAVVYAVCTGGSGSDYERQWRRQLRVLMAYVVVFMAVFLISDFSIDIGQLAHGFRLFLPLAVTLVFAGSVVCARALEGRGVDRRLAAGGLAIYLLASGGATFMLASIHREISSLAESDGYFVRGVLVHRRTESDFSRGAELARLVSNPRQRYRMFEGLGFGVQFRFEKAGDIREVRRAIAMLKIPERAAFVRGLLRGVAARTTELEVRAEHGDHPELRLAARRRLLHLAEALRPIWERLPPELHNPPHAEDRVLAGSNPRKGE